MIEAHLLTLAGHKPSEVAKKTVKFWLNDMPNVTLIETHIERRMEMLHAKHKYKFKTLPCLIINDTSKKKVKAEKFYYDKIRDKLQEIKEAHPLERRRKHDSQKISRVVKDINDG